MVGPKKANAISGYLSKYRASTGNYYSPVFGRGIMLTE